MKRSFVLALIVAVIVSGITLWLHISGVALRIEMALSGLLSGSGAATRVVSEKLQYFIVFAGALGVAWAFMTSGSRKKIALLVPVLVVELLALTWVCALFGAFFQPLPGVLAAVLALGAAAGLEAFLHWRANRPVREPEAAIIPAAPMPEPLAPLIAAREPDLPKAEPVVAPSTPAPRPRVTTAADSHAYEVTVVVCDIGNKYDLADELEPPQFGQITTDFIARATRSFTEAGAFIESSDGEGIVAVFGFPTQNDTHAEVATRAAMRLVDALALNGTNGETPGEQLQLHAGVSSGRIVVTNLKAGDRKIVVGEPIELARRFCIANRFYGSRVLIGPRTFELAGQSLIARPIDFLSGVDVRERHEIYEPISLAENATDDAIRRRDSFWNGVVLYREKRWAEAYAHFQRARSPENDNDPPLNLYLRRLEPLALQLTNTPLDEQ